MIAKQAKCIAVSKAQWAAALLKAARQCFLDMNVGRAYRYFERLMLKLSLSTWQVSPPIMRLPHDIEGYDSRASLAGQSQRAQKIAHVNVLNCKLGPGCGTQIDIDKWNLFKNSHGKRQEALGDKSWQIHSVLAMKDHLYR